MRLPLLLDLLAHTETPVLATIAPVHTEAAPDTVPVILPGPTHIAAAGLNAQETVHTTTHGPASALLQNQTPTTAQVTQLTAVLIAAATTKLEAALHGTQNKS